jgi:hypothetical protein
MKTVTGVFRSGEDAGRAAAELAKVGVPSDHINLLMPGASEEQVHSLPTAYSEQPGMGAAVGGLVGGAVGLAGGLELGTLIGMALVPGVGPVIAIGMASAALLGAGGVAAGAKLGSAAEQKSTEGLPADEIFFYEDALRQGRSVLVVLAADDEEAERAQTVLSAAGAESLDAARDGWWIGLRDAEEEQYRSLGGSFEKNRTLYRQGFEAALRRETRGKSHPEAAEYLRNQFPHIWDTEAFRRGFERGRHYFESHCAERPRAAS